MCYNHLHMIGNAALLYRSEHGKAPKSLDELAQAGCAPGVFGQGELRCPDGGNLYTLGRWRDRALFPIMGIQKVWFPVWKFR